MELAGNSELHLRHHVGPGLESGERQEFDLAERNVQRLHLSGYQSWRRERSEEHTSELQSLRHLVCRLLLEKKKNRIDMLQRTDRDVPCLAVIGTASC